MLKTIWIWGALQVLAVLLLFGAAVALISCAPAPAPPEQPAAATRRVSAPPDPQTRAAALPVAPAVNGRVDTAVRSTSLGVQDPRIESALGASLDVIQKAQKDRAVMPGPLQKSLKELELAHNTARLDWLAWRAAVEAATTPAKTRDTLSDAMIKSQARLTEALLNWDKTNAEFPQGFK